MRYGQQGTVHNAWILLFLKNWKKCDMIAICRGRDQSRRRRHCGQAFASLPPSHQNTEITSSWLIHYTIMNIVLSHVTTTRIRVYREIKYAVCHCLHPPFFDEWKMKSISINIIYLDVVNQFNVICRVKSFRVTFKNSFHCRTARGQSGSGANRVQQMTTTMPN